MRGALPPVHQGMVIDKTSEIEPATCLFLA